MVSESMHRFVVITASFLFGFTPTFLVSLVAENHWFTSSLLSVMVWVLADILLLVLTSSRHRLLWSMGLRNLLRRKRNTLLMIGGLLIASAIVTSSLVVGDSLEATITEEVVLWLDGTDIMVSGLDPRTNTWVELDEERMRTLGESLMLSDSVDGVRIGLKTSVSVRNMENELGEPRVGWYGFDTIGDSSAWSMLGGADGLALSELNEGELVINQLLGDEIGASVGDYISLSWLEMGQNDSTNGGVVNATLRIQAIVSMSGSAAPDGAHGPVVFTTLSTAQTLRSKEDIVNLIHLSAKGGPMNSLKAEKEAYTILVSTLDDTLVAEDDGLFIESSVETGSLTLVRSKGSTLLSKGEIEEVRAIVNQSNVSITEVLQAPLLSIEIDGKMRNGLPSEEIYEVISDDWADWFSTPAGLGVRDRRDGEWYSWEPDGEDGRIRDITSVNAGEVLVAHADGIRLARLLGAGDSVDMVVPKRFIPFGVGYSPQNGGIALGMYENQLHIAHGVMSEGSDWNLIRVEHEFSSEVTEATLEVDEETMFFRFASLMDSLTCQLTIPLHNSSESISLDGDDANCTTTPPGQRTMATIGGEVWDIIPNGVECLSCLDTIPDPTSTLPQGHILSWGGDGLVVAGEGTFLWDGEHFVHSPIEVPVNNLQGAGWFEAERALMESGTGIMSNDNGTLMGFFPQNREVDDLNRLPLILFAIGGDASLLPAADEGELLIAEWVGDGLPVAEGEDVGFIGLVRAIRGDHRPMSLNVGGVIPPLPNVPGQPSLDKIVCGVINISDGEDFNLIDEGSRSFIQIALKGNWTDEDLVEIEEALTNWMDEAADVESMELNVFRAKKEGYEDAKEASEGLAETFLIFGTFIIIAGMLLVVNIFVMLAEERKVEMGLLRAVGLQRNWLRNLFVMEGSILALFSSILGVVAGLFLAYLVMSAFGFAFSSVDVGLSFQWEVSSLLAGVSTGFLVTWASLWLTSLRNSRLNVVAAMRDLPRVPLAGLPWWSLLFSLAFFAASLSCWVLSGFVFSDKSDWRMVFWLSGGFLLVLALMPLIFGLLYWRIPEVIRIKGLLVHKRLFIPRLVFGITGILILGWGADPFDFDRYRLGMEDSPISFIILGVAMVGAGVLLLVALSPLVALVISRLSTTSRKMGPVVPLSLAHPLSTPFRTSLTMTMFSLVVFAITILIGFTTQFEASMEGWVEESSGDYEIVLYGSLSRPITLPNDPAEWDWGEVDLSQFDSVAKTNLAIVTVTPLAVAEPSEATRVYHLRGVDGNFSEHGGLPLHEWDSERGATSRDIWMAVQNDSRFAIVDASFSMIDQSDPESEERVVRLGDTLLISDRLNPNLNRTVLVVGILEDGSLWNAPGVYVGDHLADEVFDAEWTRIYLSRAKASGDILDGDLADTLEQQFAGEGLESSVLREEVEMFQSLLFSILNVFKSYLGVGLLVGIAGLSVLTVRAVSERRHQTGIMRAMGFQRSQVVFGYILELSWVSLIGMFNGVLMGVGFHLALHEKYFSEDGTQFLIPWGELSLLVMGAYLLTLIATALPVLRAAAIRPAEALREVE